MTPGRLRWIMNLWPPFLFAGIRVEAISNDWRYARVRLRLRWFNRNYVGTQYGGSLFSMADPFFMILLLECLGRDYIVWDRAGEIRFLAPGRGDVLAEFRIEQALLDQLRASTADGSRQLHWFEVELRDAASGEPVARVRKQLHVRRKQPPSAALNPVVDSA